MPWARSLRSEVGRQSLSWGRACLYSRSNSRQLRRDPLIWTREYAKIDTNARVDNIYEITKISGETTNEPSKRGMRGPPPLRHRKPLANRTSKYLRIIQQIYHDTWTRLRNTCRAPKTAGGGMIGKLKILSELKIG
jgi:hypothetical protein